MKSRASNITFDKPKEVPLRPVPSLQNYGNTCFISSTIWSLSAILYRDAKFYDESVESVESVVETDDLVSSFLLLMKQFKNCSSDPEFTKKYYSSFYKMARQYRLSDGEIPLRVGQHDPHELIMLILTGMLNQSIIDKLECVTQKISHCHNDDVSLAYSRPHINSIGQKYDLHHVFPLPISDGLSSDRMVSLEHLIYNYTIKHDPTNGRWDTDRPSPDRYCDHEKSYNNTIFHKFSDVIMIALSRYPFNEETKKITTKVDIPLSLDFGQFLVTPEKKEYDLIAMIYHLGDRRTSGHYTSLVNDSEKWFYCDDLGGVSPILPDSQKFKDQLQSGYIYIYMRHDLENSRLVDLPMDRAAICRETVLPESPKPKRSLLPVKSFPRKPRSPSPTSEYSLLSDPIAYGLEYSFGDVQL